MVGHSRTRRQADRHDTDRLLGVLRRTEPGEDGFVRVPTDGRVMGFRQHKGGGWVSEQSIVPETTHVAPDVVIKSASIPPSVASVLRDGVVYREYDQ